MRVAIIGQSGQLAKALIAKKPVWCDLANFSRPAFDLTASKPNLNALARFEPVIVINAAAYTQVEKAESDPDAAFAVNERGAAVIANFCALHGIPLFHISTDYVFDGTKSGAYTEDDRPNPLNVYGHSKLAGENAIRSVAPKHIIARTSWVFSASGQNFFKTMLRLARTHATVKVVADQRGCPTHADHLAAALWHIALSLRSTNHTAFPWGTYHIAGDSPVSWAAFAEAIFDEAKPWLRTVPHVQHIGSADYASAATRPLNSVLSSALAERTFNLSSYSWRAAMRHSLHLMKQEEFA